MEVTEALVDHLAHLSRLYFDPAQKQAIQQDMQKIIGFVEKLNELDTTGVEPLRHMGEMENAFRPDEPGRHLGRTEALQRAAHTNDEFFLVPKVISKS
jgi:aspartyl-tRNA(Asn)/glutamyl-tRNA(Gln) amidotransferase subunit C